MNELLPAVFTETLHKLALGVEPIDAAQALRVSDRLEISLDGVPFPNPAWGSEPSAHWFERTTALRRAARSSSCLHVLLQGPMIPDPIAVRVFDRARRFVPRRLSLTPDADGHAIVRPHLYPGAAYGVSRTAMGLRGRVAFADGSPLRWVRVTATLPGTSVVVGRAHGDDRGEFLLLLGSDAFGTGEITSTLSLEVRIFGPSPLPTPADSTLPSRDPLWDLPLEIVPVSPLVDLVSSGVDVPSGYIELATSNGVDPSETPRLVDFVPGLLRTLEPPFQPS